MKPKLDTVIQFSGLSSGRYEYSYVLNSSFFALFENDELREGNVDFEVVLEKKDRLLMFNFSFKGEVKSICDRCLGDMVVEVEGTETLCVKFSDTEVSDDEDVVFLPEDAYQIDLAQWLYEYVAVSLPIQKVHAEGLCDPEMLKYISEEHKESSNTEQESAVTDPRWDALKDLIK